MEAEQTIKPTPTRRKRGSLSREEILEGALALVNEEGVENLSMRRIAARLNCSVASPYAYFKDGLEEIIRALIILGEKDLTSQLKNAANSSDDAFVQLESIARTYWKFSAENRELHKLMFNMDAGQMYRQAFPSLPTSYRVFMETIRRGIISGQIPHSRERYRPIARMMWAWMYGLIVLDMNELMKHNKKVSPIEEGIRLFQMMLSGEAKQFEAAPDQTDK